MTRSGILWIGAKYANILQSMRHFCTKCQKFPCAGNLQILFENVRSTSSHSGFWSEALTITIHGHTGLQHHLLLDTQEYRPQRGGKAMKTRAAELNLYLPRPTIGSGVVVKLPNKSLASLHTWLALVKTIQTMATNSIIVSSSLACPLWWLRSKWIKNHPAWTSAQWETHAQKRKKWFF